MRIALTIFALGSIGLLGSGIVAAQTAAFVAGQNDSKRSAKAMEAFRNLPLRFEANKGQTDERVKFVSKGAAYTLFLTANGVVLAPPRPAASRHSAAGPPALRMTWVGANAQPGIEGVDEFPGKSNYLLGNRSEQWQTGVPVYGKVRYRNLYPGIDLVYYSDHGQLEYDLVAAPGARLDRIKLKL